MDSNANRSCSNREKYMERFQAIQKRRQEACRGSEARRVNELKLSLLANVKQQLQSADELEELQRCDVNLEKLTAEAEAVKQQRQRRRGRKTCNPPTLCMSDAKIPRTDKGVSVENTNTLPTMDCISARETVLESQKNVDLIRPLVQSRLEDTSGKECTASSHGVVKVTNSTLCHNTNTFGCGTTSISTCTGGQGDKASLQSTSKASNIDSEVDAKWLELKPYLTINDHLVKSTGSGRRAHSHLEERLEKAIEANDVDTAEIFSDKLAQREFGVRIASAIDAKAFLERQQEEKAAREAAKRKKLAWGFIPKHRWETKGNM